MADPATITLRRSASGFAVKVEPTPAGFDFDLTDKPEAYVRSYAKSLQRHHGWVVRDVTMEGADGLHLSS